MNGLKGMCKTVKQNYVESPLVLMSSEMILHDWD